MHVQHDHQYKFYDWVGNFLAYYQAAVGYNVSSNIYDILSFDDLCKAS